MKIPTHPAHSDTQRVTESLTGQTGEALLMRERSSRGIMGSAGNRGAPAAPLGSRITARRVDRIPRCIDRIRSQLGIP